ncbi:hypothetical protein EV363DRAFT_1416919 [Boletus edulis]|uniref:Uncharacterized protein n=1 Tax=Boletus edulis BED1 TaxID=1328754 RepID=A0AAD4B9K7_BOLED|nr:hypothetical protein EV363DRAFT_1416919 [Boletus edulis]KAF8414425.1 hypothetical protein L210DRAFT_3638406 [Boletus edulis BED1]KAF8435800.1 hypothetical protein L210DRAFT_3632309 [Boletus edulis BED1]
MFTNLPPGQYKIVAVQDGRPVGVERLLPPPLFQYIRLDLPCQTWQVDRAFVLSGYRYTGAKDDKVIVSKSPDDNVKWKMVPYMDDSSIISPADDPTKAWTIVIADISPDGPSSDQLFRVVRVDE